MDYLEFVENVLARFCREENDWPSGVLVGSLVGDARPDDVTQAFSDLHQLGVVSFEGSYLWLKPTKTSRQIRHGGMTLRDLWQGFFDEFLIGDQMTFLAKAVEIGHRPGEATAAMVELEAEAIYGELGWSTGERDPYRLIEGLASAGFVESRAFLNGRLTVRPRYSGVVRATQKLATEWQQRLQALLVEGETTTVDIKQRLKLSGVRDKGEFIRDVLGLATTKASGTDRYMIIGYDDATLAFLESVDTTITRNQLEQIINAYTDPKPDIGWVTIPVSRGIAGIVVVKRDRAKVPYRVSKAIWKLQVGNVYVRHGTHTEAPTPDERAALEAEGRRARDDG